jgi:hypothetical protein
MRHYARKSAPDDRKLQGGGDEGEPGPDNAERQREVRPAAREPGNGKLKTSQGGYAERDPTPRRRDRKGPEPKVSHNNSSLAQNGSFGSTWVTKQRRAYRGPVTS